MVVNHITVYVCRYVVSMYTSRSSTLFDVACREIMRKLLRNSCGSLSLRQAALIDDSESSTLRSFRCVARRRCLALRPVDFLYPTVAATDIRKRRIVLLYGSCSSSIGDPRKTTALTDNQRRAMCRARR